jgi:hypothetical protein
MESRLRRDTTPQATLVHTKGTFTSGFDGDSARRRGNSYTSVNYEEVAEMRRGKKAPLIDRSCGPANRSGSQVRFCTVEGQGVGRAGTAA